MKHFTTLGIQEHPDDYETIRLDVSHGKHYQDTMGTRVIILSGEHSWTKTADFLEAVPVGDDYNLTRLMNDGYQVVGMGTVVEKINTDAIVTWKRQSHD